MKPNALLIRHGSTALNSEDSSVDRIRAWKDEPLDEGGIAGAHKTADAMAAGKIPKPDYLATSDLSRAHDTAKIVAQKNNLPIKEVTKALRPWDLGQFAGKKTSEVHQKILTYIAKPDVPVPGGESFNSFKNRFVQGMKFLRAKYPGQTPGLVSHHRVDRLIEYLQNGDPKTFDDKGDKPGNARPVTAP